MKIVTNLLPNYDFGINSNDPMANFNKNYKKLNRYNIENYIYDPINLIFSILNKKGKTITDHFKKIAEALLNTKHKDTNQVVTNVKDFISSLIYQVQFQV